MDKITLINQIEDSKDLLRKWISKKSLTKEEVVDKVFSIMSNEPREVQLVSSLYYIDWLTIPDISNVTWLSETSILWYFQLVLFKIKLILDIEEKWPWEYSVEKLSKKSSSYNSLWSVFDKKI